MLYNFVEHKKYAIDIGSFKSNLFKNSEYLSKNCALHNIEDIMMKWTSLLLRLYNTNNGSEVKYHKQSQEKFQKHYNYETFTILFHFNVTYLKSKSSSALSRKVPIETFLNLVDYDLVSEIYSYGTQEIKPVYVVPFPTNKNLYLLVDGNHRLTYALKTNHEHIPILEFPIDIAAASLMSRFEQAFYVYINEMWELQSYSKNQLHAWHSKIYLFENIYTF